MNKKEVSKFLGVSEKTVERYKSSGKLSARLKRVIGDDGKARKILDFNESDVERLKHNLSSDVVFPSITDGHPQTKTQTDLDRQTDVDSVNSENKQLAILGQTATVNLFGAILERFEKIIEQNSQANQTPKLMLTVKEASSISGLPMSYIRQSIKDRILKANRIGGINRIKRQDLEEFVNSL
jgi:excisionase family DNA binding protein